MSSLRIIRRRVSPPISTSMPEPRARVRKTYKLYVGGAFPRSESGRSYVADGGGWTLADDGKLAV